MSSINMNKCCDDRREHNIAESIEQKFPLLCKGKFSVNEEKFFDMLFSNIPTEYQVAYLFEQFADDIDQDSIDRGIDEAESNCEQEYIPL